jgi:putative transport protein
VIESVGRILHDLPALCLFLSILLGTIIGRFHVKGVGFGSVVGTLIAGIIIGILAKPELPDMLRWSFFYLFLFSIGYSVGPQFFGSLKREALPQIALAVVVAASGLAAVVAVTAIFGFDEGLAVGVLSGAMTQSAALGTGVSAIAELPLPADVRAVLIANAPLADAITYGFGDLGLILFLTWLGPKIMSADLKREARELEKELSAGKAGGEVPSASHYGIRAYRVDHAQLAGSTLAQLEARYAGRTAVCAAREARGCRPGAASHACAQSRGRAGRVGAPRRVPSSRTRDRTRNRRRRAARGPCEDGGGGRDQLARERHNDWRARVGLQRSWRLSRVRTAEY